MNGRNVLVTGASGFAGRCLVKILLENNFCVTAGVHHLASKTILPDSENLKIVELDILDKNTLIPALEGIDKVYHFAAYVDSHCPADILYKINTEGTENVWQTAADAGVKKALYCSSTAVYGLMGNSRNIITEEFHPRAVEPYGRSKYLGEQAALDTGIKRRLNTIIIRPVAIFGPGEHTPFGKKFRNAAFSRLLMAGTFRNRRFNFVHVEDVSRAALHLMEFDTLSGDKYNITFNEPILYEDAFRYYIEILEKLGDPYIKVKVMAHVSSLLHKIHGFPELIKKITGEKLFFTIWHPGFDLNYSSEKLLSTGFNFKWTNFREIFYSCVE